MKGRAEVNARQSNKWTGQVAHLSVTVTIAPPGATQPPMPTLSFFSQNILIGPSWQIAASHWSIPDNRRRIENLGGHVFDPVLRGQISSNF